MSSIREYFDGAGGKYLALVDTPKGSNQSEIGKASLFADFLGNEPRRKKDGNGFPATFFWMPDDSEKRESHNADLSWYDSRHGKSHREPEWRLYYGRSNPVMKRAAPGDLCIVAMKTDKSLVVLVSPAGSSTALQLARLFDIAPLDPLGQAAALADLKTNLDAFSKWLLEEIGISISPEETGFLSAMLRKFGGKLPDTYSMSEYARQTLKGMDPKQDPDGALVGWYDWEDRLFREFEAELVSRDIKPEHVAGKVDVEFLLEYFKSVHNRRRSRAGHAFAHHIRAVLDASGVLYQSEVNTENAKKLDFLMPNGILYHDEDIPSDLLTALGAKTTCKDRWRQVLSEAHRISEKHLITLESPITQQQLDEMSSENLRLVIPKPRHWAFQSQNPDDNPLTVAEFIKMVRHKEIALRVSYGPQVESSSQMIADALAKKKSKTKKPV